MILPIVSYEDAVLRKISKPLQGITKDTRVLIKDMFETMYNANGVGLAAVQVDKPLRIFIVDVSKIDNYKHQPSITVINPRVVDTSSQTVAMEEGCLSIPGIHADIMRPKSITLSYRDENFQMQKKEFDDFFSRVVQHELDHLNGILFIDKITDRELLGNISSDLKKIKQGDIQAPYPLKS